MKQTYRYLPNSHYLKLIDRSIAKSKEEGDDNPHVIVYSESRSHESLDVFRDRGYELRLDGPLEEVWMGMALESDVAILSKSSFSIVPAMLRTALSL